MIYLDNNSTTPVDKRILDYSYKYFSTMYGNASSSYSFGMDSLRRISEVRKEISAMIGSNSNEIYFTSGATESLNLALKGLALNPTNKKKHLITCLTEHKAVLETCHYLESIGYEIDYLPVDNDGTVDLELLKSLIKSDTLLICLMWVNNETGVIHPINEVGKITKEADIYFVCDGTQGVGKLPIDVLTSNIDILCFSGHKMYAPKGIGGIYINHIITKQNKIQPLIHGGGQEKGLRSGTHNVPLIAGLGKAFEIAEKEMEINRVHIENLRDTLEKALSKIEGSFINSKNASRIYNTINICIPNFDTEFFIGMNKDVAVSNGSACNSAIIQPSHVLLAMGLSNDNAMSSIRISLGKENTMEDIEIFLERIHNFIAIR
ncbi:cysteine desulfurase family protein [Chryseobacterium sp. Leaf394]|uniref:cysteine desulfurase family protein n=1 Tax=Chryseobacterium sp. Leaf394 TaxID=1736361 RepID=UPI0006F37EA1|nr:cysteine desulfurase family protein [Chryseobacterium sp. Leaf394]KQS91732.1 cysteine desulfurase IscS [Chryseobacterium sp. Leaf394]